MELYVPCWRKRGAALSLRSPVAAFLKARRRGLDVEARPVICKGDPLSFTFEPSGWLRLFANTSVRNLVWCNANTGSKVRARIVRQMLMFGEGARAVVGVMWKNWQRFGGHVFCAEVRKGRVVFYDPQDPDKPAARFFMECICNSPGDYSLNPYMLRTDNRKFSSELLKACRARKK